MLQLQRVVEHCELGIPLLSTMLARPRAVEQGVPARLSALGHPVWFQIPMVDWPSGKVHQRRTRPRLGAFCTET